MKRLKYITCSGANESTNIRDLTSLSYQYSKIACGIQQIEWGIQVSGKKCSFASYRYAWINTLWKWLAEEQKVMNLALHVNEDWVEDFTSGEIPKELDILLKMKNFINEPFFGRIQLNFKIGRDKTPDFDLLKLRMKTYGADHRIILSYNPENKEFIHKLYNEGCRFDLLYDSSHGEGILAQQWEAPVFDDENILQGYAGGISPENVEDVLSQIATVVPKDQAFCIDAEGNLKGEDKRLSLKRCALYVKNALAWEEKNEAQE